jgi:hypothetical protein
VASIGRGIITGKEETCKMASRGQKKKRQCGENFINNKRPLNPTHISLKKEKQLETKTTRRAVLMS